MQINRPLRNYMAIKFKSNKRPDIKIELIPDFFLDSPRNSHNTINGQCGYQ